MPTSLLVPLAEAGLLDAWLLLDLLAAAGVLGAAALASRRPLVAGSMLGTVSVLSFLSGALWYGCAYALVVASASWTGVSTAGRKPYHVKTR